MSQVFTIPVDPGFMFDFLAIYEVKMRNAQVDREKAIKNFTDLIGHISNQITDSKVVEIMGSQEYKELRNANATVFNLIDRIKVEKIDAVVVDEANYDRFLAKRALQSKFFPEETIVEQKLGYK